MADPHEHDHDLPREGAEPEVAPAEPPVAEPLVDPEPLPAGSALAEETDEQRAEREAEERLLQLFQSTVLGPGDAKIGRVGQVYLDDQTMAPNWVTVKTGLFGTKEYFVPLDEAEFEGKQIRVPYDKDTITASPRTEIDQNLSPAEEDDLYNHYRVPGRMTTAAEADPAPLGADGVLGDGLDLDASGDAGLELGDEPREGLLDEPEPAEPADDDRAPGFFEGFSGTEAESGLVDDAFAPPADDDRPRA